MTWFGFVGFYGLPTIVGYLLSNSVFTWSLTKRMEKKLNGNYTKMPPAELNKSWRQHPTKKQLYGHLPAITKTKVDEPDMRDTAGEVRTNS